MIVSCHQELFEKFPTASVHGVVFDLLGTSKLRRPTVGNMKRCRASVIRHYTRILVESRAIKEWRHAFQTFGVKPSKYRSSIEQLYRRALKGDIIHTRFPLVNLYCYVSLIQMVPMGGYDFQKTQGDIAVRLTTQGEEFVAIGEHQPMSCDPGVVVYSDDTGIICWAWNHRDAGRTCLDTETEKAIFFVDSALHDSRGRASVAIELLTEIMSTVGANKVGAFVLDQQENYATLNI